MTTTPLASSADFNATPYSDIASHLQSGQLDAIMLRATARCESLTGRRLAVFAQTESKRVQDTDVEDGAYPLDGLVAPGIQIAGSYAASRSISGLVRHFWVDEFPANYSDLWTGAITGLTVNWAYSNSPVVVPVSTVQFESDTGHGRFAFGTLVPPGSTLTIAYTGGYSTVPADLQHASITLAASMVIKMLDPTMSQRFANPDLLHAEALDLLRPYTRS